MTDRVKEMLPPTDVLLSCMTYGSYFSFDFNIIDTRRSQSEHFLTTYVNILTPNS